jgi:hypothetical protein
VHVIKLLFLLEGIHTAKETIVLVSSQLLPLDQPLEWLANEIFARFDVIEDLAAEGKETRINPRIGPANPIDVTYHTLTVEGDRMKGIDRWHCQERRNALMLFMEINYVRQTNVG